MQNHRSRKQHDVLGTVRSLENDCSIKYEKKSDESALSYSEMELLCKQKEA